MSKQTLQDHITCNHINAYWTKHVTARFNYAHELIECPDCQCHWTVNTRNHEHTCQSKEEYLKKIKAQQDAEMPKEDLKKDKDPQITINGVKSAELNSYQCYPFHKGYYTLSLVLECTSDDGNTYEVDIPTIDFKDLKLNLTTESQQFGLLVEETKREASLVIPVTLNSDGSFFTLRKVVTQAEIEEQLGYKVHIKE